MDIGVKRREDFLNTASGFADEKISGYSEESCRRFWVFPCQLSQIIKGKTGLIFKFFNRATGQIEHLARPIGIPGHGGEESHDRCQRHIKGQQECGFFQWIALEEINGTGANAGYQSDQTEGRGPLA